MSVGSLGSRHSTPPTWTKPAPTQGGSSEAALSSVPGLSGHQVAVLGCVPAKGQASQGEHEAVGGTGLLSVLCPCDLSPCARRKLSEINENIKNKDSALAGLLSG